mgnify:CR=1 FL=1
MSTDSGPFERVYDAHVVGIYRYIHARVGNHPDAEDLTAQVFVRAVEQLDTEASPIENATEFGISGSIVVKLTPQPISPMSWRMNDMPTAVMSGASFGALRSGR